jgi:uncharacterized membrane protein (UPF0182 family)
MTGTKQREIDFQNDDGTQYAAYEGKDGVALDNIVKRAAFALRFADYNPFISNQITSKSKIHYVRDIRDRVESLAPFLDYDADPYPVIVDGRVQWVLDAYTTTSMYPYGQTADVSQLTPGSGLDHRFNYVRNSVKAVVDAYDGTVEFYVMPGGDPIIEAYRDAFPSLFSDFADMPTTLQEHLRYPEDMFRVQTNMWANYHVEDPDSFYSGDDSWDVASDPGTAGTRATTATTDSQGNVVGTPRSARIDPYYLFTQLPGADAPEFILLRPFVPRSRGDDAQRLAAFMVGNSEPEDYGKLQVFVMPRGSLPNGPALVQGEVQSDEEVSRTESLLGGGGSTVSYGGLTAIPIDGGLVWVRPFYVTSTQTKVPALQKVIVYFEGDVIIRDTLQEALEAEFGASPPTLEDTDGVDTTEPPPDTSGTVSEQVSRLLVEANDLFRQADAALAEGDLGKYQDLNEQGRNRISRAEGLLEADVSGSATSGEPSATQTTTSTTSTTRPASA